jgi:hypothetical protein
MDVGARQLCRAAAYQEGRATPYARRRAHHVGSRAATDRRALRALHVAEGLTLFAVHTHGEQG